jgi:alpha-N-acetylglucosaminidase
MKLIVKLFSIVALLLSATGICSAQTADELAAKGLAQRVLPNDWQRITFKQIKTKGHDTFQLSVADNHLTIAGNNAVAMAVGLNRYLNRYCLETVSWYGLGDITLPAMLPTIDGVDTGTALVDTRFFLNYCTFGYTMPFWGWEQWEKLIDWMALSGINMPLAITGQEGVWRNVWRSLGMSDDDVRAYFTGPTYLPWHRMANIDKYNGPLPAEWLDGQIELQKQILGRERELGMRPVLPAFNGHVPEQLKTLFPNANIQSLGRWASFEEKYSCHFLNPNEPLFAQIQKLYLEEQTRLFGTDHIYGVDPFNEVTPPSWEPSYLKQVSRDIFKTLTAVDKKAVWLQMAWMFYYEKRWTPERIEALLTGVPRNKMILLDYYCEKAELWKKTDSFYNQPYIWCYLGNFGGNTPLQGNLNESSKRITNALANGGKNLQGIGSTLEGLDVMQVPFEYVLNRAWTFADGNDNDTWVENVADRHAGKVSPNVREAWKILFNEIFTQLPRTRYGIMPSRRPELDNKLTRNVSYGYSQAQLVEAWKLLANATDSTATDALTLDIICVGRQALGNYFAAVKEKFDSAYHERNLPELYRCATVMQQLIQDIDFLTAAHPYTSLKTWLGDARAYAKTPEVAKYYEHDARNLITTWGTKSSLNDYACRTLSGLTADYYATRWQMYIDDIINCARTGTEHNKKAFAKKMKRYEDSWVKSKKQIKYTTCYDPFAFSRTLLTKYGSPLSLQSPTPTMSYLK